MKFCKWLMMKWNFILFWLYLALPLTAVSLLAATEAACLSLVKLFTGSYEDRLNLFNKVWKSKILT